MSEEGASSAASPYSRLCLVTPATLATTVLVDRRTALWAWALFSSAPAVARITQSPEGKNCYRRFLLASRSAAALVVLALAAGGASFFASSGARRPLLFGAVLLLAATGVTLWKMRQALAQLAEQLAALDASEIPAGMSLYQVGELWARKYRSASLVGVIWLWDQCLRETLLLLFVFTFGVLFLPFWQMVALMIAGMCVMAIVVAVRALQPRR